MEEFKAYVTKNTTEKIIITAAGVLFLAIGIFVLTKQEYLIGIVGTVFGLAAIYGGLSAGVSDAAFINKLEDEGRLSEVLEDFKNSRSFVDDKVKFGNKYIFQYKCVKPILYEDIASVTYGWSSDASDHHCNEYRVSIGYKSIPTHPLYSVRYDHPDEANEMIAIIKSHNPNVIVK